jgi:putative oxygen-independent coproporphyrinogen III oxidase
MDALLSPPLRAAPERGPDRRQTGRDSETALTPLAFDALPPLALYVHLPWCVRKCPYCDFNSYEANGALPESRYVEALLADLDHELVLAGERRVESVFLGGGTPSLFSGAAIARLLDGIRARVPLAASAEVTLEANPGAVEAERFAAYREAGVNRLSIGAQSFRSPQLHSLGRVHDPHDVRRAIALARSAGFASINVDLMYALPEDEPEGALADLATALDAGPSHLSWYQLTLEPNTAFARRPPPLPAESVVGEIERLGRARLAAHGFERYEISAYARAGARCVHNVNYWTFGDYIGVGAGAHGKLTMPQGAQSEDTVPQPAHVQRRAKSRNPRTYMERAGTSAGVAIERITDPRQLRIEFLMNALRLPDGVSVECFEQRAGQSVNGLAAARAEAERRGWLSPNRDELRASATGLDLLNALLALFC